MQKCRFLHFFLTLIPVLNLLGQQFTEYVIEVDPQKSWLEKGPPMFRNADGVLVEYHPGEWPKEQISLDGLIYLLTTESGEIMTLAMGGGLRDDVSHTFWRTFLIGDSFVSNRQRNQPQDWVIAGTFDGKHLYYGGGLWWINGSNDTIGRNSLSIYGEVVPRQRTVLNTLPPPFGFLEYGGGLIYIDRHGNELRIGLGNFPWVEMLSMGYLYSEPAMEDDAFWAWNKSMDSWLWIKPKFYPWLYTASGDDWLYFLRWGHVDSGNGFGYTVSVFWSSKQNREVSYRWNENPGF
jgi:hypothetical protein